MRKLTTLGRGAAMAMAEMNSNVPPSVGPPPQPSPANCDAHKCPWWPYSNAKDFKANTALVLVILFCALICALAFNAGVRYFIRSHCFRRRQRDEKADPGGAAADHPPEIPSLTYSEGMELAGAETECIICLSEFAIGEKIRVLEKCNHGFHLHCIQKWLISHSSCPTCRTSCSIESNLPPP
ncbi:RING-H2 finger protein ATL79-like [Andrographis paniculata]|uniref:RING-H2 finger protein ATL79-like n=1 Tax=Andrographis paniculata TaxID=175694 RepID=UPI0021E8DCB5|nr:RING-H2 finger protein ATL79-like [Andrographis paniculata]XP_051138905.1 RING-H2 finger protein ATL79-like [Andrographis paniculata]XP_051138906.1 RING-H2 finger protein ATL79-like [Andrographis paniculata]